MTTKTAAPGAGENAGQVAAREDAASNGDNWQRLGDVVSQVLARAAKKMADAE